MALRIRECLKEDGAYCDSPAFHGHNCRLLDRNVRRHPLKHAHPAANSLPLNILPASLTGSIFCGDFRLSPPVFSIFYEEGGRGRGGAPVRTGSIPDTVPRSKLPYNSPVQRTLLIALERGATKWSY